MKFIIKIACLENSRTLLKEITFWTNILKTKLAMMQSSGSETRFVEIFFENKYSDCRKM